MHQFAGVFVHPYLNGTADPATPSELLYYSVVTLTTVGFGEINPASTVARAVTVTEALTGQLYLVSVVAGVVGGWRGAWGTTKRNEEPASRCYAPIGSSSSRARSIASSRLETPSRV